MADATEKTTAQVGFFAGSTYGGTGFLPWKAPNGSVMLPPDAALVGSGTFDNTNAYSHACLGPDGTLLGLGGGLGNLNGFGPLPGTFHNYRIILRHPTCALARAAVVGPILASSWGYVAHKKKAPSKAKQLLSDYFEPIRLELLTQALRILDYGFQAFELVWGTNADGWRVPVKIKPLLQDITNPRVDAHGNYVGLSNAGVMLEERESLWLNYNVEGANLHGCGRVENIRRAWANWLVTDDQAFALGEKASSIIPMIYFPPDKGKVTDPEKSNYKKAVQMAYGLMRRRPIVMKNHSAIGAVDDPEAASKLADKSDWVVKTIDMGNLGPAMDGSDRRQRYLDTLICRGWLRPERSVIEAQTAGSRADSEAHTASIADTDADLTHAWVASLLNRQLTNRILFENFGPKAVDAAAIKPREIVDERRKAIADFAQAVYQDPMARVEWFNRMDMDTIVDELGLKKREDAEPWPDEMPALSLVTGSETATD